MPRFYFHILNGKQLTDDVGLELADLDAAKAEALRYAGAVLSDEVPLDIWEGVAWQIKVTDGPSPDEGQTFLTLSIAATDGSA